MIDNDLWLDFIGSRSDSKKPMTDRAINRMLKKLDRLAKEGYCPNLLLERSIINGWKDVYPNDACKPSQSFIATHTDKSWRDFVDTHTDRSWADNVRAIK